MKHTDFDAQIKSSLEQMEFGFEPATWDMLRQKMDRTLLEEEPAAVSEVDKAVFHKLQNVEMPYQPAHWDMLADKMAEAARLRRRLWIGKIAEAAIFLLLLVNIDSLVDMGDQDRTRPDNRMKSNRPQVDVPGNSRTHRQYAATPGQQVQDGAGFATTRDEYASVMQSDPTGMVLLTANPPVSEGSFPSEEFTTTHADRTEGKPHLSDVFAFLSTPDATPVAFNNRFKTPVFPIKPARSAKMYAATFATYNRNLIKSEGEMRAANGFGGGIAVGYRKGKWAVEAGLAYTQTSYQPKREVEIYAGNLQDGYLGTFASQIHADVFSVPVKATRRMGRLGRTQVYATAGVTGNVSVQKSYQYKTVAYGNGPQSHGGNSGHATAQPQLSRKGTGLLEENGKLAGNFYATADLGMRVQHPVGKRFAAFVEPVYHQSLGQSGIGPKTNRINTFSVNAGVVASL